jgi:hypothetical protein
MKNRSIIIYLALFLTSCHKYLDVTPKGIVIPSTTAQYEGMLNSPALTQTFPKELLYLTDDVYLLADVTSTTTTTNAYLWQPYLNAEDENSPAIWGSLYSAIYYCNVIINRVMSATDSSTVAKKQQVLGEAMVVRSYCYLDLLTVFAKAYNASTAATDPGLPLVTSTDVGNKTPSRSSVQTTLDTMISNTLEAVNYLPASSINKYRLTVYGAYGLLSRIFLYMGDYTNAKKYAELALTATHSLLNYNSYTSVTTMPVPASNPEVLWQRTSTDLLLPYLVFYSGELRSYYDSTIAPASNPDLRYRYLALDLVTSFARVNSNLSYGNFGITFPEMYLTRAEAFARNGDATSAMAIVNTLRKNRIKTASYTGLTASTAAEALTIVLAERRRELAFGGLRWFDMKRLDQDARMQTVKRINAGSTTVLDSLPPHSSKYTFQIPARVQGFNPAMELN